MFAASLDESVSASVIARRYASSAPATSPAARSASPRSVRISAGRAPSRGSNIARRDLIVALERDLIVLDRALRLMFRDPHVADPLVHRGDPELDAASLGCAASAFVDAKRGAVFDERGLGVVRDEQLVTTPVVRVDDRDLPHQVGRIAGDQSLDDREREPIRSRRLGDVPRGALFPRSK